jgi:hypothetical protein
MKTPINTGTKADYDPLHEVGRQIMKLKLVYWTASSSGK